MSAMSANLLPYPTYKPSGIEWLGDVPENWQLRRLRDSTNYCVNGVWGEDPDGNDDLPCVRVADFDRHRLRIIRPIPTMRSISPNERRRRILQCGDLLLEKSGGGDQQPVGVVMLFDHEVSSVCSNFIARISVSQGFDSLFLTFLHSALYSIGLNTRSIKQTTGIQNLDSTAYLNESVAFPPLPEQRAIARYLDYMDRSIQRYIRSKEKLIELLEEQKRAVINQAVTRGLDPDVPLKPSGVEWLGDVPAHWEVRRLKTMCRMKSGDFIATESIGPAGKYAVYGGNGLRGYTTNYNYDGQFVLVGRQGALCGNVHLACGKFWATEHAVVATLGSGHDVSWFGAVLDAMNLNQYSIAAAQPGLAIERIMALHLPVPERLEQERIAAMLKTRLNSIANVATKNQRLIELVEEYRTRLIADVATGKLDVRDAVANLPDDLGDDELIELSGDPERLEAAKIR